MNTIFNVIDLTSMTEFNTQRNSNLCTRHVYNITLSRFHGRVNDFMCHCTHQYYEYKKTSFKEKFEA